MSPVRTLIVDDSSTVRHLRSRTARLFDSYHSTRSDRNWSDTVEQDIKH